jgi:hypothetical protein
MTLRESELARSRRARRSHDKQQQRKQRKRRALDAPLSMLIDEQVLTFFEWCQLNRFSERTGRRILASGDGPVVTQLGPKRIGVTVANNRRWQQTRARL